MSHPAGEPFVLLDDPAWLMLPDDLAAMTGAGGTMLQWAPRNGSVLTEIEMAAAGQALRPLSPVHAQIRPDGAGGLTIGWTRRSRSEEHTSELQSLMRISYAVFCLQKKNDCDVTQTEHDPNISDR